MLRRRRRRVAVPLPSSSDEESTQSTSNGNVRSRNVMPIRTKRRVGVRYLAKMVHDLSQTVATVLQSSASTSASSATADQRPVHEAQLMLPREGMIPHFDPEKGALTIEKWIAKIEELKTIFNWSETATIHHAVINLRGLAQQWYSALPNIVMSWGEWRVKLLEAFPSQENYCTALAKMLHRQKLPDETYLRYYYDKLTLLTVVRIVGKDAVSCIIGGIGDSHVRATAEAGRHETPESLLKFLQLIETQDHQKPRLRNRHLHNNYRPHDRRPTSNKFSGQCFLCKKSGHRARDCRSVKEKPKPTTEVCQNCKKQGHSATTCWANKRDRVL